MSDVIQVKVGDVIEWLRDSCDELREGDQYKILAIDLYGKVSALELKSGITRTYLCHIRDGGLAAHRWKLVADAPGESTAQDDGVPAGWRACEPDWGVCTFGGRADVSRHNEPGICGKKATLEYDGRWAWGACCPDHARAQTKTLEANVADTRVESRESGVHGATRGVGNPASAEIATSRTSRRAEAPKSAASSRNSMFLADECGRLQTRVKELIGKLAEERALVSAHAAYLGPTRLAEFEAWCGRTGRK